jgi:hypothetical protein
MNSEVVKKSPRLESTNSPPRRLTYNVHLREPNRIEILKQHFANSVGLPFKELLPESTIIEILEAQKLKYRNRLSQCHSTSACHLARAR